MSTDAESLFRSKPVSDLRNVEAETRILINKKKEELRQLIGNRYRDLIDSADSITRMKSSCELISSNISSISNHLFSLSHCSTTLSDFPSNPNPNPNPNCASIFGIASRVKYLVDTPENIWGCLDEFMFFEAASRFVRAKLVYQGLIYGGDDGGGSARGLILRRNFPLLSHQWQIVESFKGQISGRSRDKLMVLERGEGYDVLKVEIGAFADALAGVAVIDELDPWQAFGLFLELRKGWILQRLNESGNLVSLLCEVTRIIQVTIAQVGEMFLQVLNNMPLFYKVILGSPPASQLFGGIPNPDEEERLWNEFREKLESVMVILDRDSVARSCSSWLRECGQEIVKKVDGRCLIDSISNGAELACAEKLVREIMDSKDVLEGSLAWLKSVFGSDVELPWSRTRELVLEESVDLWDEIFEDAFVSRMKDILDLGFDDLIRNVNVPESIQSVGSSFTDQCDFRAYLHRSSASGGVWFIDANVKKAGLVPSVKSSPEEFDFRSCLSAYFGPEASRIRDAVDSRCHSLLDDLLSFLESPKASLRLNHLATYMQNKCYESVSIILTDLKNELDKLHASLENVKKGIECQPPATIVEKSLFIGRLLFALLNHSKHISVVLGSPRFWVNEARVSVSEKLPPFSRHSRFSLDSVTPDSPAMQFVGNSRRQSRIANALFGASDNASPKHEEVINSMRDLCIAAHGLWISWISDELANILSEDLRLDDGLLATTPLRGWEEVVVKQDPSSGSDSEMKILLPSLPSLYVVSFLFRACEEAHRVGGHVLDKVILQRFAKRLLEKVIDVYSDHVTNGAEMSEKGVLQVLLDLRFAADILSGCDSNINEGVSKSPSTKSSFRRKQEKSRSKSALRERIDELVNRLSQKLDPMDWQTFEPYLWENERQSS